MRVVAPDAKFVLVLYFFLPFCFLAPPAHADGGAPDLAYVVAGTANGVSIIEIIKQQAAGTLNVAGNPSMILLSVDGRLLYVAQPDLTPGTRRFSRLILAPTHFMLPEVKQTG